MIILNNLSKSYIHKKYVIENLNLTINQGEILALIGHNGAGKTTTLKMLSGILKPTNGDIQIYGQSILNDSIKLKRKICYVPDKTTILLELTGFEYLEFIGNIYCTDICQRQELTNLLTTKLKLQDKLNTKLRDYSQGMRKKIMIIGAFISNASIMLLDEPLTGLDPEAIYIIKDLLIEYSKKGNIVIFSTHLLDIAESFCSRFFIINKGQKVFDGDINELHHIYGENTSLENVFMEVIK